MADYLEKVSDGKLPMNHQIIYNLQDIFNLCPNLQVKELVTALKVNTNDNMLVIYVASLIRSIIALHNLINNKLKNQALEKQRREKDQKAQEKALKGGEKEKVAKKDESNKEESKEEN